MQRHGHLVLLKTSGEKGKFGLYGSDALPLTPVSLIGRSIMLMLSLEELGSDGAGLRWSRDQMELDSAAAGARLDWTGRGVFFPLLSLKVKRSGVFYAM